MSPSVRKVLARYYEDPQDSLDPTSENVPFLQYLAKRHARPGEEPNDGGGTPGKIPAWGPQYNPFEYEDPSSKPKDVGDGGPFVKDIPSHPMYNKGIVFQEDSPLRKWQKARRRDWTQPPKDQQPAISVVRRHASVNAVVARYLHKCCPVEVTWGELEASTRREKQAYATLNQVLNKDYHYKNNEKLQRAEGVSVNWVNEGNEEETGEGKFVFTAKSSDSPDTHTVILAFHQASGFQQGAKRYVDLPIQLACSCPSFLWYGAQWYANDERYMWLPSLRRDLRPPVPHTQISRERPGKGLNFRVCKHLVAVYNEIENWELQTEYKSLMVSTPVSKIMNPKEFERLLGIPFTYQAIKEALGKRNPMTPKMREFFRYKVKGTRAQKKALNNLSRWFHTKWRKLSETEKGNELRSFINHPEEIFYLLLQEAIATGGKISDQLLKEGVIQMSKVINPDYGDMIRAGQLDAEPPSVKAKQEGLESVPEAEKEVGDGTGFGGSPKEEGEEEAQVEDEVKDEPVTKKKKSPKAPKMRGPKKIKPKTMPVSRKVPVHRKMMRRSYEIEM